jgi:hypothetical protein
LTESGYEFTGPTLDQRGRVSATGGGGAGGGAGRDYQRSLSGVTPFGFFGRAPRAGVDIGIADRVVQEGQREAQRLAAAEEALADARLRANAALVTSLANVGRAYGGVTDQVLNLAAATMSIYQAGRLPNATRTDRAVGYGSAALAGIGFGQSTGNPLMGGIGGGLAGAAMVAGPYGAILGATAGFVSGLLSQAERAKAAQRAWEITFQAFEDMFDTLTPEQQVDRQFQRSFGMTVEEARGYVELFRGLEGVENIRRALESYDRQMKQAAETTKEQAAAERELYDARFRALNAPQGFNVSYYGWGAGFGGASQAANTGGDTITVNVVVDGETIATTTQEHNRRAARRGGAGPYSTTAR